MVNIHDFDDIRPYEPEEFPDVYDRLLSNKDFLSVVSYLFPGVGVDDIRKKMYRCTTSLSFQKTFSYPFLQRLLAVESRGCDMDASAIDIGDRYTFMSNHRDIVLDSAFLAKLLIDTGCATTCEIAIGDNLLSLPWVKDLVRLNKSFIVKRDLPISEQLEASRELSEYMHFAIGEKGENIWIAQREGRAKDSDDRTETSILKMMAFGGDGTYIDRLRQLHIVPLAISYEYDPCDYLKAKELQQRRDDTGFRKGSDDDITSMKTGIMGYKGRIHYHLAPCIDEWLRRLDISRRKNDVYNDIARHIDSEIHRRYRLYAVNYIALDLLEGVNDLERAGKYTPREREGFESYISCQLEKVDLPRPDYSFLRHAILMMYAYPARNKLSLTK